MFNRQKSRNFLQQPKIFRPPVEKNKESFFKKWSKATKLVILLAILVLTFVYLIFLAPWFKIKRIEIVGSPNDQIQNELDKLRGHNIFSFSSLSLEQKLISQNRNFSNIKIYRGIPDTVRVVFENRNPKLIWESSGSQYLVDSNAVLYKQLDLNDNSLLPKVVDSSNLAVKIPEQISSADFVEFVNSANSELKKSNFKIQHFEVAETTFQLTAVNEDQIKIMLNVLEPLSEQMNALNKVYIANKNDIKEYVDLRVEGRVYYK